MKANHNIGRTVFPFITALFFALVSPSPAHAQCGDADDDGILTIADILFLDRYLHDGGPPPPDFTKADIDGYAGVTVMDAVKLTESIFGNCHEVSCPTTLPPFTTTVNSNYELRHLDFVPANATFAAITLALNIPTSFWLEGFTLPFSIRVDGNIPTINSIDFLTDSTSLQSGLVYWTIEPDSAVVVIGGISFSNSFGPVEKFAAINISVAPSPNPQPIVLEWVVRSPVQAPSADSTLFALITSDCANNSFEPILAPVCANDADGDGVCDIDDICPGFDDNIDSDSDGIPDGCDICSGFDDALDVDADGIPDGCDPCNDNGPDADGDGIPDECDPCPAIFGISCCSTAGDANNDGQLSVFDMSVVVSYLFLSGPPPASIAQADVDGYPGITIKDLIKISNAIFEDCPPLSCPTILPPFSPAVNPEYKLTHLDFVPPNTSVVTLYLTLSAPGLFEGFTLPLSIRVNGNIPSLGTVTFLEDSTTLDKNSFYYTKNTDSAEIIFNALKLTGTSGPVETFASVDIAVTPSPDPQPITLEWVIRAPGQAPAGDSSIYAVVVKDCGDTGFEPITVPICPTDSDFDGVCDSVDICLGFDDAIDSDSDGIPDGCDACPGFDDAFDADADGFPDGCDPCPQIPGTCCCDLAGDANNDNGLNIGDATFLVRFIFNSGQIPNCLDEGDADGAGDVNVGDATYIVKFIFQGGADPVCGTTGT